MSTIQRLLAASAPVWAGYHTHPFILGIQNGTLPREKFRHYILQDYLYLIEYAKVFALGLTKTRRLDVMELFTSYIGAIIRCELDTHNGYMARLEISREELHRTPVALASRSYTAYMLQAAYEGGDAEALTAVLSCAYSYEVIARTLAANAPAAAEHPFYGSWVRNYAGERYHEDNCRLLELLERLTADAGEPQLRRLEEIFLTCSRYEAAFWDMAWHKQL